MDTSQFWSRRNVCAVWEAAMLWIGRDPKDTLPLSAEYYQALDDLRMAFEAGTLQIAKTNYKTVVNEVDEFGQDLIPGEPITIVDLEASIVTRDALVEWANQLHEVPAFLRPTARKNARSSPKAEAPILPPPEPLRPHSNRMLGIPNSMQRVLLSTEEAAELLGVSAATLSTWRSRNPAVLPWIKSGRKVFYELSEIEAYLARQRKGRQQVDD